MRNAYMASSYFQLYRYGTGHPKQDAGTPFSVILQSCLCQHVKDRFQTIALQMSGSGLAAPILMAGWWRITDSNR